MSVFRITRLHIIRWDIILYFLPFIYDSRYRNGRQPSILANFSDDSRKKDSPENNDPSADKKVKDSEKSDNKKEVTSKKLNELLALMSTDLGVIESVVKPRSAAEKMAKQKARSEERVENEPKSANIAEAAKKVANALGGDTKKTESELLSILLKSSDAKGDQNLKY